jgi:hypothetical protein
MTILKSRFNARGLRQDMTIGFLKAIFKNLKNVI